MRVTSGVITRHVIQDIENSAKRLQGIQSSLSSGKRIQRPSDDPAGTARALSLRQDKADLKQFSSNIGKALDWLNSTSLKLDSMEDTLLEAVNLGNEGVSDFVDSEARSALSDQLDQYLNEFVDIANSKEGGKALFGGSQSLADPFSVTRDAQQRITAVTQTYPGSTDDVISREIGKGQMIGINTRAGELLQPDGAGADTDVFGALVALRDALKSGTVDDIKEQTALVQDAYDRVVNENAIAGAKINRLESTSERLKLEILNETDKISAIEDTDYVQSSIDYAVVQNIYQSALSVGGQVLQLSLVDYI